jgi:hypothetical protein
VGDDVLFEGDRGAVQFALNVDECVRAPAIAASPIVVLSQAGAFVLAFGFLVKLSQTGAHLRQFLTCHARQYSAQREQEETNYGGNLPD